MDPLNQLGQLRGSQGLQGKSRAAIFPGPRQTLSTGTPRMVPTGQQLGANAVSLVRGTFLRNLATVVAHVSRMSGMRVGELGATGSGLPEAPTVSGWDGQPLDQYGLGGPR